MERIPRPDLKKRFLCTICEAGTCELIVENYDKAPTFCPYDKELRKWEEVPEGAKNTEQQVRTRTKPEEQMEFEKELEMLINKHSKENESDTPDFILAQYLKGCMTVYAETIKARDKWYGFKGLSERSSDI